METIALRKAASLLRFDDENPGEPRKYICLESSWLIEITRALLKSYCYNHN